MNQGQAEHNCTIRLQEGKTQTRGEKKKGDSEAAIFLCVDDPVSHMSKSPSLGCGVRGLVCTWQGGSSAPFPLCISQMCQPV